MALWGSEQVTRPAQEQETGLVHSGDLGWGGPVAWLQSTEQLHLYMRASSKQQMFWPIGRLVEVLEPEPRQHHLED